MAVADISQFKNERKNMNENLLINRGPQTPSQVSGGTFWRLTWVDIHTGQQSHTLVDSTMRNFPMWEALVSTPNPYGVYIGLSIINKNTTYNHAVATADAVPRLIHQCVSQDEARELHQQIKKSLEPTPSTPPNAVKKNNTFHSLFSLE